MSDMPPVGNTLERSDDLGFFIHVFDHRPESLAFMEAHELQGGGPTWMALVTAALELETPSTLDDLEFDDEADVVLISSPSEPSMRTVQQYVSLLMSDEAFREQCIEHASGAGYLE